MSSCGSRTTITPAAGGAELPSAAPLARQPSAVAGRPTSVWRIRAGCWALVILLAASCAAGTEGGPRSPEGVGDVSPVDLIGIWDVVDSGADAADVLLFAPRELRLWHQSCRLFGGWDANAAGMFVAHVFGSSGRCERIEAPNWLARTTGFRHDEAGPVLLDSAGEVTARLRPRAAAPPDPNTAAGVEPPEVTDGVRARFAPPAPLPGGWARAGASDLVGRWLPADPPTTRAYVELHPSGAWRGSDGCNHSGGRWVAGPDGLLLAISGPHTLIACDNIPIDGWLVGAARAALADGDVVLFDRAGDEIARLRRA